MSESSWMKILVVQPLTWYWSIHCVNYITEKEKLCDIHSFISCSAQWGCNTDVTMCSDFMVIAPPISECLLIRCLISDVSTFFCAYFQLICRKKVDEGKLPRIKNTYIYLYAISTGVLFHAVSWNMQIYHCFSFHEGKTQFVLRLRYVTSQHLEFGRIYVWQFSLNYVSYYPQKHKKGRSIILHLIVPVQTLRLADRIV